MVTANDRQFVVTLPHTSGLPRDVTVNTFSWKVADPVGNFEDVFDWLEEFYNDAVGGGSSISSYLATLVSRATDAARIEAYSLTDPQPRLPVASRSWTVGGAISGGSLPAEVALCASHSAPRASGQAPARRRGRVFLGPFKETANASTGSNPGRPDPGLLMAVANASARLAGHSSPTQPAWCVWSRTDDELFPVTHGWVDNDWDTQRRRQPLPTSRETWTISP